MGLPCMRWIVTVMALRRLSADRERNLRLMTDPDGSHLTSKARVDSFVNRDLHSRCDGTNLQQCSAVPAASAWLQDDSSVMSVREYIVAMHVRYNCLYSKSRAARGRDTEKFWSRDFRVSETLNLISQQCFVTQDLIIKRHNALSNYLARSFEQRGYSVHREPLLRAPNGRRLKSDLLTYCADTTLVVDSQVNNDPFSFTEAHHQKINKYEVLRPQLQDLRPNSVYFSSWTFSWRALMCLDSVKFLSGFHILRPIDIKILAICTLSWSGRIGSAHQGMTLLKKKTCVVDLRVL